MTVRAQGHLELPRRVVSALEQTVVREAGILAPTKSNVFIRIVYSGNRETGTENGIPTAIKV